MWFGFCFAVTEKVCMASINSTAMNFCMVASSFSRFYLLKSPAVNITWGSEMEGCRQWDEGRVEP